MVKKELINKKVVRAIALGLSAVMLTTPITAHAETADGTADNEPNDVTTASVEESASTQNTVTAVNNAQDTISNVDPGSNVVVDDDIDVVLPSTVTEENPEGDVIVNVPDAVEAAGDDDLDDVNTTVNGTEITYADVVGEAVEATEDTEESNTGLLGANAELEDAEVALEVVDNKETEAKGIAGEASTIISEIDANNTTVTEAAAAAQTAADKAEDALKEAQAATTKAAAQEAVNKAEEAFKEATAAQAAAQTAYEANEQKLEDANTKLADAEKALAEAKAAKDTTVEELAAAHAAVSEAADNAAALKAQVDADAQALAESEENALKVAYDNMMAQSVYNRYSGGSATAEDADEDGIGDEFTTQFGSESASSAYWDAADAYFELYLEYIYKNVYGHEVVKDECGWTRNNTGILETPNPDTPYDAEIDNTYTVTYIDENGEKQVAYYNYHTALDKDIDGDGELDVKKGDITIYEKVIAVGKTEAIWEKGTEEYEYTELVTKTRIEQQEQSETTSEDALSIENTDEDGTVTYTKLDDVKKDTDVVLTEAEGEDGKATSVLVKDDNSELLDSEEAELAENQKIVEGTSEDSYRIDTYTTYVYGTKEEQVGYSDRIGSYDNLVSAYNAWLKEYPAEAGYRVEIVFDYGFGDDDPITLEEARGMSLGSTLGAMWDCGFELKVYKTVEDTNNIVGEVQQKVIVKTTTATVATTTQKKTSDTAGDRKKAEKAAEAKVKELGLKEGTYSISYKDVWDGPFDKDCKYTITYSETTTDTQQVKSETYSATEYNMHNIATTRTWMEDVEVEYQEEETFKGTREIDVLIRDEIEYNYWKERRNTSNDDEVKAAIDQVRDSLDEYVAKKDAAAVALAAALQAKADVEKAQSALDDLEIDNSAYLAALEEFELAKTAYENAEEDWNKAKQAAEDAGEDYKDAAEELGRFVPSNDDSDDDDDDVVVIPTVNPDVIPEVIEEVPVNVVTPAVAAPAVVDIEDEATPLAGGIGDGNGNGNGDAEGGEGEAIVAGAEETAEPAIVAIEDEETPLAAGLEADAKMSWWWLLIIALLGATGYKMYKDHQKKKEEQEV